MKLSLVNTRIPIRQGVMPPLARNRRLIVSNLSLPYQYQARAEKLRKKGYEVVEFGDRVMREGCFGEDVLQLQNFLAEEGYYNPVNGGYTGYFGGVTKESLQDWQKDHGLDQSGVFDSKCKWAYLKELEAKETQIAAQQQQVSSKPEVVTAPTPAPKPAASQPTVAVSTTYTKPPQTSSSFFNPLGLIFFIGAGYAAFKFLLTDKLKKSVEDETLDYTSTEYPDDDEINRSRLSPEEIQKYIAPMKGGAPSRTPLQRPPPRPLRPASERNTSDDPFLSSKYGTYYGGRKLLDRVAQNLAEEGLHQTDAANNAAKRLASIRQLFEQGQQQPVQQIKAQVRPPSPSVEARQSSRPVVEQQRKEPISNAAQSSSSSSSFEDVEEEQQQEPLSSTTSTTPASSPELLAGTDLESDPIPVPPRTTSRPVNVQRPERLMPQNSNRAASSQPQAKPRPVPVVRPESKPATIGEAMRMAEEEYEDMYDSNGDVKRSNVPTTRLDETVVLDDKPVKLHKPSRLVSGARTVPSGTWESVLSTDVEENDRRW